MTDPKMNAGIVTILGLFAAWSSISPVEESSPPGYPTEPIIPESAGRLVPGTREKDSRPEPRESAQEVGTASIASLDGHVETLNEIEFQKRRAKQREMVR